MKYKKYDAAIVLGYDVSSNGQIPLEAKNRVKKAKELLDSGFTETIVFTGDLAIIHHFRPRKTESLAMQDYAIELGVPKEKIILEKKSRSTYQNALYTKRIVDEKAWQHLAIITGEFHKKRAEYIFRKVYDSKYDLDFIVSENGLSKRKLRYQKLNELKKWIVAKKIKSLT